MKYTNYRLTISYDGTAFSGWQKQTGRETDTVQGRLEAVASRLAGEQTSVNGAGRTDAGVSALCQAANVKLPGAMKPEEVAAYFNKYLPETVSVDKAEICPERFHARLWASRKTYEYFVAQGEKPPVFCRKYVYCEARKLDHERLEREAALLPGKHDMIGFSSLKDPSKSTVRTITAAEISLRAADPGGQILAIRLTGDGFLYNQVRIIAGTLLDVAAGKLPEGTVTRVFETGDRQLAGFTAPPNALFLTDVSYDALND